MESVGKYLLNTHKEQSMEVKELTWHSQQDQAILEWKWPLDKKVKLMLVFPLENIDEPDLAQFLEWDRECTVVSRNLANNFRGLIKGKRQKFMLCPAYFNEHNKVVVYNPVYFTDWLYKKNKINAKACYKPLLLSRYAKVTFDIEMADEITPCCKALKYGIYENNRLIGEYPLDKNVISGKYTIYIRKKLQVRFMVEEAYVNQFEIY